MVIPDALVASGIFFVVLLFRTGKKRAVNKLLPWLP